MCLVISILINLLNFILPDLFLTILFMIITFILYIACLLLRRWNGGRERNGSGRRCELYIKIPVKTFPIKKRINTELFIDRKWGALYTKSKGGIGSRKYWTSQKRVEYWREIKEARVNTAAACLDELTITWKGS